MWTVLGETVTYEFSGLVFIQIAVVAVATWALTALYFNCKVMSLDAEVFECQLRLQRIETQHAANVAKCRRLESAATRHDDDRVMLTGTVVRLYGLADQALVAIGALADHDAEFAEQIANFVAKDTDSADAGETIAPTPHGEKRADGKKS